MICQSQSKIFKILFLPVLLTLLILSSVVSGEESFLRTKRGAAYSGGYGGANGTPKLTPSVALGTYGGFSSQSHPGYRKFTVEEALGSYGGHVQGPSHQGPTTIGNDAQIFNQH